MSSGKTEKIYGINGPVIYLKGKTDFKMSEMVHVGEEKLVGEVISLDKDRTTVQVYEETSGLHPGELVEGTGAAVSVTLAPGILNNIFDGIERPLERIADKGGAFITRGVSVDALDRQKLWETHITVAEGDMVQGGTIIAEVPETRAIVHKCNARSLRRLPSPRRRGHFPPWPPTWTRRSRAAPAPRPAPWRRIRRCAGP